MSVVIRLQSRGGLTGSWGSHSAPPEEPVHARSAECLDLEGCDRWRAAYGHRLRSRAPPRPSARRLVSCGCERSRQHI